MSAKQPSYSVIIPVYNEESRLPNALQQIEAFLGQHNDTFEIIFVNDGSTDDTVTLLQQSTFPLRIIEQPANQGKGWAVRRGMLEATGDYRAFIDADMATPIDQVITLFNHIDGTKGSSDIAIGSRITSDGRDLRLVGKKPQSITRRVLGKLFRLLATKPFLGNIRDSQCGAKAFSAAAAQTLFSQQKIKRWSFDIEILYLARKNHLAIQEIPVEWSAQEDSKLQPSVSLAWNIVRELATIAWIHR